LTRAAAAAEAMHPEHVAPLVGKVLPHADADDAAEMFGLLADPTRMRILHALGLAREICVYDLALLLGVGQSALSHQLRLLRDRNVVARRRDGRVVYYSLADEHVRRMIRDAVGHSAEASPRRRRR